METFIRLGRTVSTPSTVATNENKVSTRSGRLAFPSAMSLIDTDFMAVVIASMKGKDVPSNLYETYSDYIARSTQACGMGSAM